MELGRCPKCNSQKVRTGHIYLRHLLRLARGSRRRYCRDCRSRWLAAKKVRSPWAGFAGSMPVFAAAVLALGYLSSKVWFAPLAGRARAPGWADSLAGTADADTVTNGMEDMQGGDAAGVYGQASGARGTGQRHAPMRWGAGQLMELNAAYRQSFPGTGRKAGQSQDMQEILRQLAAIGKTPRELASEIDSTDKQTLWNKYGSRFASKEDAKAAYDDFQSHRGDIP